MDEVINTYARAQDLGFKIKGIHAHIGSGGQSVEPFLDMMQVIIDIVNELKELGIELDFIDMGGGIGVPYKPQEDEMDLHELASEITDMIEQQTDIKTLILEPGRYIVCDAVVLLTKVNDVKDAGPNKYGKACTSRYEVVGPICESGDYLAHDRVLPDPHEGDIVAVYNAGAYGFSMSSNYNSRPLCAEVLVNDGKAELIREPETIEELWRHQKIPERLM